MNPFSLHDHDKNSYSFSYLRPSHPKINMLYRHLAHTCFVSMWSFICVVIGADLQVAQVSATPRGTQGDFTGSIVGRVGAGGQWARDEGEGVPSIQGLDTTWGVTPGVDYALNHFIWVGGEASIAWMNEPIRLVRSGASSTRSFAGGQRLTFTPALRARLDFPIDCRWIIEAGGHLGVAIWGATRDVEEEAFDERRWGISWQTSLGVRYVVNTQVHLVITGGYSEQQVYTDRGSINVSLFPISLGLRGGF